MESINISTDTVRSILRNQYHAALAMLRPSIARCPEDLWYSSEHSNAFWQIAYHSLFFTHLYIQPDESAFQPWAQHQSNTQNPDGIAGEPDPASSLPLIPEPYSKQQVLTYWQICDAMVDAAVGRLDLNSPDCGFWWYKVSKLEHQFISIRHIQHHGAQLADRVRAALDIGTRWVASGRGPAVRIFHLTSAAEFEEAQKSGEYVPGSFASEEFIHCSYAHQVTKVANARFKGRGDTVLLEIDCSRLGVRVVDEDLKSEGESFPHIYGRLPISAVVQVHRFMPNDAGLFELPVSITGY